MSKIKVAILKADNDTLNIVEDFDHSLENMQEVVGGYIEAFDVAYTNDKRITAWLNEEGKLIGLPPNFGVLVNSNLVDIIMGDVLFTAVDDMGETVGLTDDEIDLISSMLYHSHHSYMGVKLHKMMVL